MLPCNCLTSIALTRICPVVLAHIINQIFRTFAYFFLYSFSYNPQHIRIWQTELCPFINAFSVNQTVIFGMFFVKLFRRHKRIKSMNRPVGFHPARLFTVIHCAVNTVACCPHRFKSFVIKIVADLYTRLLGMVEPGEFIFVAFGNNGNCRGVPPATQLPFQKREDSIHCAALPAAVYKNICSGVKIPEWFVVDIRFILLGSRKSRIAYNYFRRIDVFVCFGYRKLSSAGFPQPVLKLLCSPFFRFWCIRWKNNFIITFPVIEQWIFNPFSWYKINFSW